MNNSHFQVSTDEGHTWKPVVCNHDESYAMPNIATYKGQDENGYAVFELSNGMTILAEYQKCLEKGAVYEFKFDL